MSKTNSSQSFFARASPLPPRYYYYLGFVEPAYNLCLALYAILAPTRLYDNYLDFRWVVKLGEHGGGLRGNWAASSVGQHLLTLALISTFLLYTMQTNLRNQPEIHENLLLTYLLCLSLFDILSIFFTFSPLPARLLQNPTLWTWTFIFLLVPKFIGLAVRGAWFMGKGRPSYGLGDPERTKRQQYFKVPTQETPLTSSRID